ncbi:hypothetical protein ACU6U9_11480 [Pseudomonas sp. HK3]
MMLLIKDIIRFIKSNVGQIDVAGMANVSAKSVVHFKQSKTNIN